MFSDKAFRFLLDAIRTDVLQAAKDYSELVLMDVPILNASFVNLLYRVEFFTEEFVGLENCDPSMRPYILTNPESKKFPNRSTQEELNVRI